jgi:hypothetical protein
MAGELWRGVVQFGKEVTAGTSVAATRKMYFEPDVTLAQEREARVHKFSVGRRDNVLAQTLGPQTVMFKGKQALSADELIELLLATVAGGVTPTGASPYVWTFAPGTTLDALTVEWQDGARPWEATGVFGSTLKISGSVDAQNTVEFEGMGLGMVQTALTGGLTDRVPTFIEGWETKLYIDAFGGTAGTTAVNGTLVNWEVSLDNKLAHEFFAQNSISAGVITLGEIEVTAKLTFRADPAVALTEFNNWNVQTERLVQLEFGQNDLISVGQYRYVKVNLPGSWSAVNLGGSNQNSRMYELSLQYVYDVTNAFGLEIEVQNARATAF